jgi:hypothetical protein
MTLAFPEDTWSRRRLQVCVVPQRRTGRGGSRPSGAGLVQGVHRNVVMQRIELVELQPLRRIVVEGDLYSAPAESLSVHRSRIDRYGTQRHCGIHPPVSAAESVRTASAARALKLVFPAPRAAEIDVYIAVNKVIAVQESGFEYRATPVPVVEGRDVAVHRVVAVKERDIGVRVGLDASWQVGSIAPVPE